MQRVNMKSRKGNMKSRKGDIKYFNFYGFILYSLSSYMRPVIWWRVVQILLKVPERWGVVSQICYLCSPGLRLYNACDYDNA